MMYVCMTHMWKPKADVRDPPHCSSTLLFEAGSLTGLAFLPNLHALGLPVSMFEAEIVGGPPGSS